MGRGASKGGKGGGVVKTTVTTQDGTQLDLSNMPLVYGPDDPNVSDNTRKSVMTQEASRIKAKTEYGAVFDRYGNQIGNEIHGKSGNVNMPGWMMNTRGGIFTHNHPRGKAEKGFLGGTFSDADLRVFAKTNLRTFRASTAEGTYSITKLLNFNKAGFQKYTADVSKKHEKAYAKTMGKLRNDVIGGKISFSSYLKSMQGAFNKMLIDTHNDFIAGQKQYGYFYTLEGGK